MLDSSPVALPPIPRPLKRSASNASLPPTPPRTHRKHARGRSRGSCDSDSDEDIPLIDEDDDEEIGSHHKKRRVGEATASSNEEAFWLSDSAGLNLEAKTAKTTAKASTVPLLYRRLEVTASQAEMDVAPVSPPPSNRKSAVTTPKDPTSSLSPPRTPITRSVTRRALLDSPDNPFLSTPQQDLEDSATPSPSGSSANPSPHTPTVFEKPTVAYVFRGVRRIFENPLYDHKRGRAFSPPPESKLPIEHPDYSPPMHCNPKLLFPGARKGKKPAVASATPATRSRTRHRSPSISDEDDVFSSDLAAKIRPKKLDFGAPKNKTIAEKPIKGKANNAQKIDKEHKTAGEPFSS